MSVGVVGLGWDGVLVCVGIWVGRSEKESIKESSLERNP